MISLLYFLIPRHPAFLHDATIIGGGGAIELKRSGAHLRDRHACPSMSAVRGASQRARSLRSTLMSGT